MIRRGEEFGGGGGGGGGVYLDRRIRGFGGIFSLVSSASSVVLVEI